jgi:hypothetical protein
VSAVIAVAWVRFDGALAARTRQTTATLTTATTASRLATSRRTGTA